MATIQEINEQVSALQVTADAMNTGMDLVLAKIAELKAQVEAGTPVTQADLDSLSLSLASVKSTLDEVSGEVVTAQS